MERGGDSQLVLIGIDEIYEISDDKLIMAGPVASGPRS
jgi:hypothetical protein